MEPLAVPLPLQEEVRLLQPRAETPAPRSLAAGPDANRMMGLRFSTEVDGTARVRPSTTRFPARSEAETETEAPQHRQYAFQAFVLAGTVGGLGSSLLMGGVG